MQSCCGSSAKQFRRNTVSVASDWTRLLRCSFPNDFLIDIPNSFSRYVNEYFATPFEKQSKSPLELNSIETAQDDIFKMTALSIIL